MDTVSGRENAHEQEFQRFDDEIVSIYISLSPNALPARLRPFKNKKTDATP